MIDRNECVDGRIAGRLKFIELQLAFERGKNTDVDTLQTDRGLFEIDQLDTRDRLQDFYRRFNNTGYAGVPVQGDPHLDLPMQQWRQLSEPAVEKPQKRG